MSCKHLPGESCHCNQALPCLTSYQVDSEAGSMQYKGGKFNRRDIGVVDKGKGATISVSVVGDCCSELSTCPSGYITDHKKFSEALSATACQQHVLTYNPEPSQRMDLLGAIQNLLSEKKTTRVPSTRYQICLTQCAGKPQQPTTVWLSPPVSYLLGVSPADSFVDVYPTITIKSKLTLAGKRVRKSISDKERYQAYQHKESAAQLDSLSIPTEDIQKGFAISGSLIIHEGSQETQYGLGYEHTDSNIPGKPSKRELTAEFDKIKKQMNLIRAASGIVEQIQSGIYTDEPGKGKDEIKAFDYQILPPSLSIEGEQRLEMIDNGLGVSGDVTIKLAPIIGIDMKLDMLMAAAKYFKSGNIIKIMREKAAELEKKVEAGGKGAYAGAEFDILLSATLNAEGQIHYAGRQDPTYRFESTAKVPITGNLNARAGANVWVMVGAFKLKSRIKAEGLLALTTETKDKNAQVELVFFHDGIWAEVTIDNSFTWNKGKEEESSNGDSGWGGLENKNKSKSETNVKKQKWQWVDAQTKQASPYRVTVIG